MPAAVIAVVLAALCFATTGTARAVSGVEAGAVGVGLLRVLVGGGLLGLVGLLALRRGGGLPSGGGRRIRARLAIAMGAVGVLGYQPAFFAGVQANGVAIGTVVALGSAPIATGLLDAAIRRRRPTARWMLATGISLVGVVLVSGLAAPGGSNGGADAGAVDLLGLLASVGAGVAYALYALAGKVLIDDGWASTSAMGAMFGTAALLAVPLLALVPVGWAASPSGLGLVLWLGIVTTAIAYLLFGWGLRRLAPTTVSTLTLVEPLGATLLGLLVLQERLSASALAGVVVIAVGLAVLTAPIGARRSAPVSAD